MTRNFLTLALPLLLCAGAEAATISTNLTVSAAATIGTNITGSGPATLTGVGTGTFTATLSAGTSYSGPYTITLSSGTISGVLTVPLTIITGSGSGSATITGGTGTYAGATGSFPNLAGAATGVGTGAFTLTFTGAGTIVTGGSSGPTPPSVSAVLNNYSYIPAGFPNSGIAAGSIAAIFGANMADPNAQALPLQDSTKTLPLTLNGASVSVTVGGATVHPAFYYATAGQLAVVIPSGTPSGAATLTVTYNNTASAPFSFQIAPAALGLDVYNGSVVATNPTTGALYTYTNSAKPGETIVLWGAGLGGIAADSDTTFTQTPHLPSVPVTFYIGGIQVTALYAGGSGYPGLDQINITVPQGVQVGCNVSLVAVSGSGSSQVTSNATTLPVATGGGACSDPVLGTSGSTTQTLSGKTNVNSGFVGLTHSVTSGGTQDSAVAVFQSSSGASYTGNGNRASLGSCTLVQAVGTSISTTGSSTGLDAGSISVKGPNGTVALASFGSIAPGTSGAQLAAGFIPTSGGAFTFTGLGGANVGSFNTTVNLPNPLLTWTNTAAGATVTRANGTTITWTGGAANTYVEISGTSTNTASGITAAYYCYAPVAAGQFAVPAFITLSMPSGTGSTTVSNTTPYGTFTASGIDLGLAFSSTSQQINTTFN